MNKFTLKSKLLKAYKIKDKTVTGEPMRLYCYHYDCGIVLIIKVVLTSMKRIPKAKLIRKFKDKNLFQFNRFTIRENHISLILKNKP